MTKELVFKGNFEINMEFQSMKMDGSKDRDLISMGDNYDAKTSPWNFTNVHLEDLKMDSNFAWLLCSLVSAMAWVIYITHYDSRVIGFFITRLLNRFVAQGGYMKVGSFTWSALAGKIMFRDVVYITNDYSVRVQDGWLIFRWWRAYVPKDVSEDLSHSDTRLSLMLNGFELHTYNRSSLYARLEKLFGLDSQLYTPDDPGGGNDTNEDGDRERSGRSSVERAVAASGADLSRSWRDLIPVIKVDVSSGRVVFGNRLVPTTLSINVEEAHFVYSTKPAASRLDHFMHFVKCKAENFKVILAPSPKYTGMVDDPPRYMGEGFVVLSSNNVELYYYMDEPGLVPEEPEMLQLANGDIVESAPPIWGMDIKCGKGTDFSYGPWADRQREHLFKFFFPNDCQPLKVTKAPQPGEKRHVQSFDIRLSTLNEATIDILFSKNKETNAVHVNVGPGSYLEVTMPWIVLQDGYTTKITGQLLHLEATTSLQYRSLVESETLEFTVKCHYPIKWDDHQEWVMNFTGCKATANIIYAHKAFFQDMVNDWASKARPDILHFVPYTWKMSLILKEFEVISVCNEYNWIDCSSQNQENALIAFCGDLFDLSFDLPFTDFLPQTIPLRFWIQGESVDLALYLPEVHSSRSVLLALDKNAKILGRDNINKTGQQRLENTHKWRNVCQRSAGWVDCWTVQIVALSINYTFHPTPPLGPPPQADITTPEKEEILLSPMRFPRAPRKSPLQWAAQHVQDGPQSFDPTTLPPDKVSLELELSPSVLLVYGSWLRNFMHLKENIFGDDQTFTDMQQSHSATFTSSSGGSVGPGGAGGRISDDDEDEKQNQFDPRLYRPLEVSVSVTLHDVQAHLVKNCGEDDPPCPVILLERFGFEMKKGYRETKLQLLLSPATLLSCDHIPSRAGKDSHLEQGHLMLSGLQVRGHAMFSDEGRFLDEETLEYAWLLELQLGKLNGKLTTPQLHHLVTSLETFALLLTDSENTMRSPHFAPMSHKPGTNPKTKQQPSTIHGFEPGTNPTSGGSPSNRGSALGTGMHSSDKGGSAPGTDTQRTVKPDTATATVPNPNLLHPPLATMPSLSSSSCASSSGGCGTGEVTGGNRPQQTLQRGDSEKTFNLDVEQGVKYRMVRVAIDALDLYLVESGTALQIWASPIRVATCNLHSRNIKSGVTGMIPMVQIRQFISTGGGFGSGNNTSGLGIQSGVKVPPTFTRTTSDCGGPGPSLTSTPLNNQDMWLEVGIVNFGPLIVEAAISPPNLQEGTHQIQQKYLKLHDEKLKRLWFLWDGKVGGSTSRFGGKGRKCGCTGGCAFFGTNRNGPKFFTPSRHDVQEGINIAAFRIHGANKDPGFGQSILHDGQLVFHTPPYGSQDVSLQEPSRWDIATQAQEPSPKRSRESNAGKSSDSAGTILDKDLKARESTATPSPIGHSHSEKQPLARRFSCTSAGGVVTSTDGGSAAKDVPYARLLDSPALPPKLDSDSRLDVPEATVVEVPKSSCSDSKLSVDYFGTVGGHVTAKELPTQPTPVVTMSPPSNSSSQPTAVMAPQQPRIRETKGSIVNTSDSHHSLTAAEIEAEISQKVQRTVSMSSENHSEAFFSADEDPNVMAAGAAASSSTVSGIVTWPVSRSVGTSERKFPSEMSIAMGTESPSPPERNVKQSHSVVHPRLSSHCSDHEIHTPEHRAQKSENSLKTSSSRLPESGDGRLRVSGSAFPFSEQPGDLEVNDDEDFPEDLKGLGSIFARPESGLDSSSDSHSVSSTSFISAVSSQEDLTLVNLHMQVNKPIIDSPLLMSCYVNHLSQVKCTNWSQCSLLPGCDAFSVPLFQRCENGKLHYIGGTKVPRFETFKEGFTSLKMVGRRKGDSSHGDGCNSSPPPPSSKSPTRAYAWDTMTYLPAEPDVEIETDYDDELISQANENGTKISLIVKLKGDMDVMVCPLVLESLQRFVDALTPMMSTLHPLTVLNRLHAGCISRVEAANILKKEQSAYLSQLQQQTGSRGGTAERVKEASSKNSKVDGVKSQGLMPGVYEESISTQTQGTIMLPKVNITLLQTSVVEEIISFSALDNLRDLTCVSLFAVCFNDLTAQFYVSKQAREVVHTFHRPAPVLRRRGGGGGIFPSYGSGGNVGWGSGVARVAGGVGIGDGPSQQKKLAGKVIGRGGGSGAGGGTSGGNGDWPTQGEAVHIETSEKQQEEVVVSLSISHIHSQLRRLRNESSILKQAVVTAIPSQHSRVLFTCTRIPSPLKIDRQSSVSDMPNSSGRHSHRESSSKGTENFPSSFPAANNTNTEDRLGFIMFECGFEGVSLKVVKRSQFVRGGTGSSSQWSDDLESILGIDAGMGQESKVHKQKEPGRNTAEGETMGKSDATDGDGAGENTGMAAKHEPGSGNASSCVMEFKTVWFNFAAPPRAPITRKLDYTRLDWNLLSTASPAINAWLNPSNRFAIRTVHMLRTKYRRSTGIVACLMAEALDVQGINMPPKSRYGRLTPLAKTLQEDPSCQLCNVLQKYVLQTDLPSIEANLKDGELPLLSTLRQGVIVLSRQWKNVLYTPLLLEHNYKSSGHLKPLNIAIRIPPTMDEDYLLTDGELSGEECEVTDECTMLLNAEGGSMHRLKNQDKLGRPEEPTPSPNIVGQHNSEYLFHQPINTTTSPPSNPRSMHVTPNIRGPPMGKRRRRRQRRRAPKKEKAGQQQKSTDEILINVRDASNFKSPVCSPRMGESHEGLTTGSSSSGAHDIDDPAEGDEEGECDDDSLDGGESGAHFPSPLARNVSGTENEDLYTWMSKQQEFMKPNPSRVAAAAEEERQKMKGNWDSKLNTMTTDETVDESTMMPNGPSNIPIANYSSSLHLLDAHLIFEPLLTCLGVMPGQISAGSVGAASESASKEGIPGYPTSKSAPFENWGSNISVAGSMETMRIDIVVSECGKGNLSAEKRKSGPSKSNGEFSKKGHGKFRLDIPSEMPAFLCEKIGVELDLRKLADTSVDDLVQRHNVLYISRGQLRKHTSTLLNFSVDIRYISQQVNMPLLRLLHQISNMYQNVKETQMELRGQQQQIHSMMPHPVPVPQLSGIIDPKNGSSSVSDLQEHAAMYEDGAMDSVKIATLTPTLGLSNSASIPKGLSPSASLKSRPQSFAQKFRSTSKSVKAGYMNLSEAVTTPTFGSSPTASRMDMQPMTSQSLHHSLPHPHPHHYPLPSPVPPASLSSLGLSHDDMSLHATITAEPPVMSEQPLLKMPEPPVPPKVIKTQIPSSPQAQPPPMAPPHCWKTIYYLLDLYATMPETKTITHRFSMAPADISEGYKGNRKYDILTEVKSSEDVEKGLGDGGVSVAAETSSHGHTPQLSENRHHQLGALVSSGMRERTRLVVFGVARIQRTRLLATLSGLKLEAEISSLQASLTCRRKSRPASLECSLAGQVGRTMIVLLEGVAPNQQTVVKVTVGKSQALYSSLSRRYKDKNSGLLTVGPVCIDIPQHPVALHGMMTRGSKQLSSTLQELRVTRSSSRISRGGTISEETVGNTAVPDLGAAPAPAAPSAAATNTFTSPHHFPQHTVSSLLATPTLREREPEPETSHLLQPLVMQFSIILQSLRITAALLPSLQAQYKMDQVNSTGVTGSKAKFTIDLPQHSLSFTTKLQVTEANLPSAASIELPKVHVMAEYVQDGSNPPEAQFADGVILRQGSYLSAVAEIGVFEHSLTTDLLNHLVFVQKVFMKEVNEVVQKVYGGEKPVPIWLEGQEDSSNSSLKRLLFSLVIRIKRIQLTATTPTNSAVRLETGAVEFQLSNRVQNVSTMPTTSGHSHPRPRPQRQPNVSEDNIPSSGNARSGPTPGDTNGGNSGPATMKIFGKAQVDVNLSLGQLIKNVMFEEAEPEFQQFAFFKTRIGLRNAFQDEMVQRGVGTSGDEEDKEVVLITLRRPLIYIQPLAVDKAILVWLNYRNAYEYWNEQRSCLNKEVLTATQQVFEKVPFGQLTSQLSSPHMGTLFLQLTVDDMGICLPLNPLPSAYNLGHRKGGHAQQSGLGDSAMGGESRGAVVVTLESTSISACSSGSLVSKGRFVGLCLRFADDFETSLDDWKPDAADSSLTNLCVVSEGTYEVCSRTIAQKQGGENAKWILNVQWQMEGVDIHLDVNVGKQLSALGHTLTTLTGAEEEEEEEGLGQTGGGMGTVPTDYDDSDDADRVDGTRASQESIGVRRTRHLPGDNLLQTFARNPSLDARQRSKLIEKEMNEQAKIINDLRSLGASHGTIEQEMRRLHELEAMVFKDFRRDMIQKLRRQSVRASSIKGKFGLGGAASAGVVASGSSALGHSKKTAGVAIPARPGTFRSHSFVGSSSPDHQQDIESPDDSATLLNGGNTGSFESSPHSGPSRSTSLRVKGLGPRVTFSESHNICCTPSPSRQSSLISGGDSELSLGDIELSEGWQQQQQKQFIQDNIQHPAPIDQSSWEEELSKVELRRPRYQLPHSDYSDMTDGSVPLLSPYSSRDRGPVLSPGITPVGGSSSPFTQKAQEPNIDFELDVKVLINSGKCVLHTKDPSKEEELKVKMKKERSVSGGIFDFPSSPNMARRGMGGGGGKQESSSSKQVGVSMSGTAMGGGGTNKLRLLYAGSCAGSGGSAASSSAVVAHLVDITIFHIPGLDVKVHYESKTLYEDIPLAPSPRLGPDQAHHMAGSRAEGSTYLHQQHSSGRTKGGGIKKASLFAWMTLQSIPEETIISPHILEFLEQTLEPIPSPSLNQPTPSHGKSSTATSGTGPGSTIFSMDLDSGAVSGGSSSGMSRTGSNIYGSNAFPSAASSSSFPVDVIVYFHMQPSTFRFSCLPVSRVECMLQLPSLDIVFSSKRAEEEELYGDHGEVGPTKPSQPGRPSLSESGAFPPASSAIGGLSVTGCLADFSVYIFHPYGGGKKSGLKEAQWSPLADSERKDSLSVNVEFVKFHLSRSRKLNFGQQQFENIKGFKGSLPADRSQAVIRFSTIVDIGSASFKYDMRRLTEILAFPKAWYRRSIVRRLFLGDLSMGAAFSEGEEEADEAEGQEEEDSTSPSSSENKDGLGVPYTSQTQQSRSFAGHETSSVYPDEAVLRHSVPLDRSSAVIAGTRDRLRLSLEGDVPSSSVSRNSSTGSQRVGVRSSWSADYKHGGTTSPPSHQRPLGLLHGVPRRVGMGELRDGDTSSESKGETSSASATSPAAWETLVLFAVNFTKLNVHMNMGNVMGNVMWLTKDFHSEGRLSIGSNGHKNVYIGMGLGGSSLDAKGGIVGGTIELSRIDTYVHIREDPGIEPDHTVGLKLFAVELRLDYMGTGVLMSRVSSLDVSLRDEWKIHHGRRPSDAFVPTKRPAMIFMHGDLGWDQLQLMISKSTTADLLKMFYKLEEFFSQQFKSSKRVFSSLQPWPQQRPSLRKKAPLKRKVTSSNLTPGIQGMPSAASATDGGLGGAFSLHDARHHRHWQRVLREVGGLCLPTVALPLPHSGTVLGGTMELHGNNISLACFHGINFKSKSWALFSLKEPCISFATEAQEIPPSHEGEAHTEMPGILQDVHVVQTLTFSLGMTMVNEHQPQAQHHSMATVCKMSRNVLFPPQFRTLQEWFHYAFAGSEIDAVDRFPSLEREKCEGSGGSSGPSPPAHAPSTSSSQPSASSGMPSSTGTERRSNVKLQDPNHTREVIFALPSLQLHLKTEHLQTARTPDVAGETYFDQKPVVDCSFITEFEDHIFVTVDAEAFFFLHDLITSYVREKERVVLMSHNSSGFRSHSPDPESKRKGTGEMSLSSNVSSHSSVESTGLPVGNEDEIRRKAFDPAEMFQKDWRTYVCKTWHLEPTVRLLSWAGKSIEPYGVDYILQKLGFSHARTTIPKWMQRGFMDPLDKVLSVLVIRMVSVARGGDGKEEDEEATTVKSGVERTAVVALRQKKTSRVKDKGSVLSKVK